MRAQGIVHVSEWACGSAEHACKHTKMRAYEYPGTCMLTSKCRRVGGVGREIVSKMPAMQYLGFRRQETKSSAMVRHLKDSEKRSDQLSGAGGMP